MDITIRERTEDDDPAIVAIRNAARPWLPPSSVDEYRWQSDPANSPPNQVQERWVAERDGSVVAVYAVSESVFVAREHTFNASISVIEAQRNQGIGDQLYHHLMDRAVSHGANRIIPSVGG